MQNRTPRNADRALAKRLAPRRGSGRMHARGFSYVEMLVALSILAMVATIAVIAYSSILSHRPASIQSEEVIIAGNALLSFYALNTDRISVARAPSYSAAAQAESMREQLYEDVNSAVAVFCLGRNGVNQDRMTNIAVPSSFDGRTITNPMTFRALLPNLPNYTATTSNAVRARNSTLFIIQPSASISQLAVRAIYETDMIATITPPGVYATVRRYVGSTLTSYYHVFYPSIGGAIATNTFSPLAMFYPRDLSVGRPKPFTLVWWPDPASPRLPAISSGSDSRDGFTNMAGQSSLFFVIPTFPAL